MKTIKIMNQDIAGTNHKLETKIHPEQLDQVVEAILAGKYSWACVLMLKFVGYNPMHYIPYRTYNRIVKENSQMSKSSGKINEKEKKNEANIAPRCLSKIKDIAYREVGVKQKTEVASNTREKLSA